MVFKKGNIAWNRSSLVGRKFGRLLVIEDMGNKDQGSLWRCVCDCGQEIVTYGERLTGNHTRSCGCWKKELVSKANTKDLTGKKFGRLTVLEKHDINKWGNVTWKCLCDCGNNTIVAGGALGKTTKSCGCYRIERTRESNTKDLTGRTFNRLKVIEKTDIRTSSYNVKWLCECICGKETIVNGSELINGNTKSCGCFKKDKLSELSSSRTGERSNGWKGGVSFEPYCPMFNKNLKRRVRDFFNNECVLCGKTQDISLAVHHVEYDKYACCNDKTAYFAALCRSCHGKTNNNRIYWESVLHRIIDELYDGKSYYTKEEHDHIFNKRKSI